MSTFWHFIIGWNTAGPLYLTFIGLGLLFARLIRAENRELRHSGSARKAA